jgi:hypothetical protein
MSNDEIEKKNQSHKMIQKKKNSNWKNKRSNLKKQIDERIDNFRLKG